MCSTQRGHISAAYAPSCSDVSSIVPHCLKAHSEDPWKHSIHPQLQWGETASIMAQIRWTTYNLENSTWLSRIVPTDSYKVPPVAQIYWITTNLENIQDVIGVQ